MLAPLIDGGLAVPSYRAMLSLLIGGRQAVHIGAMFPIFLGGESFMSLIQNNCKLCDKAIDEVRNVNHFLITPQKIKLTDCPPKYLNCSL